MVDDFTIGALVGIAVVGLVVFTIGAVVGVREAVDDFEVCTVVDMMGVVTDKAVDNDFEVSEVLDTRGRFETDIGTLDEILDLEETGVGADEP